MAQINFNSIYTSYYRKSYLFAFSYVHNEQVAEDIVSEAIIHLWELSKEREIPSVEAILITYIRSKALNYLKHIQARENVIQNLQDRGQRELEIRISTLEACDPNEILSEELRAKVKTLDGKTYREIADELGMSVKGVEYHIGKAIKILRENLKDYAPCLILFL